MLKNRSVQVKLVKDQTKDEAPEQTIQIDPEKIIESAATGVAAIIVIYKVTGLLCSAAEHVIVTKIK